MIELATLIGDSLNKWDSKGSNISPASKVCFVVAVSVSVPLVGSLITTRRR
jgi:hypothetical protein